MNFGPTWLCRIKGVVFGIIFKHVELCKCSHKQLSSVTKFSILKPGNSIHHVHYGQYSRLMCHITITRLKKT